MDAFDNPARNGIIGSQQGGASADQMNKAASGSDFLTAAAHVTATAAALPLAIQAILVPDASGRSEEHTSELQSLMRTSYAVFCLKKKNNNTLQYTIEYE